MLVKCIDDDLQLFKSAAALVVCLLVFNRSSCVVECCNQIENGRTVKVFIERPSVFNWLFECYLVCNQIENGRIFDWVEHRSIYWLSLASGLEQWVAKNNTFNGLFIRRNFFTDYHEQKKFRIIHLRNISNCNEEGFIFKYEIVKSRRKTIKNNCFVLSSGKSPAVSCMSFNKQMILLEFLSRPRKTVIYRKAEKINKYTLKEKERVVRDIQTKVKEK